MRHSMTTSARERQRVEVGAQGRQMARQAVDREHRQPAKHQPADELVGQRASGRNTAASTGPTPARWRATAHGSAGKKPGARRRPGSSPRACTFEASQSARRQPPARTAPTAAVRLRARRPTARRRTRGSAGARPVACCAPCASGCAPVRPHPFGLGGRWQIAGGTSGFMRPESRAESLLFRADRTRETAINPGPCKKR